MSPAAAITGSEAARATPALLSKPLRPLKDQTKVKSMAIDNKKYLDRRRRKLPGIKPGPFLGVWRLREFILYNPLPDS
jgi:hypothetical protein